MGRDNLDEEADSAKKHGAFVKIFHNLTLFSVFRTNSVFIKATPNSILL